MELLLSLPLEIRLLVVDAACQDSSDPTWTRHRLLIRLSHCNRALRQWFLSTPLIWHSITLSKARNSESEYEWVFLQMLSLVGVKEAVQTIRIENTDLLSLAGVIRILDMFPQLEQLSLAGSYGFPIQSLSSGTMNWVKGRLDARDPPLALQSLDLSHCGNSYIPHNASTRDVRGHYRRSILKNKNFWDKSGVGMVVTMQKALSSICRQPVLVKPEICQACTAALVFEEFEKQDCHLCLNPLPHTCSVCQPSFFHPCRTCKWLHGKDFLVCATCADPGICRDCLEYFCSACSNLNEDNLCKECAAPYELSTESSDSDEVSEDSVEEDEE